MPPAFVLSQDQTLKFMSSRHQPQPHKSSRQTNNAKLQEPIPALVKRNGYEGHTDIDLVTGHRSPKTPDTRRRRPHVPSSKTTMSKNHSNSPHKETKSGGQPSFPDLTRGDECPSNDWATNPAAHLSSTASVKCPLRSLPTTVNPTLQFLCRSSPK